MIKRLLDLRRLLLASLLVCLAHSLGSLQGRAATGKGAEVLAAKKAPQATSTKTNAPPPTVATATNIAYAGAVTTTRPAPAFDIWPAVPPVVGSSDSGWPSGATMVVANAPPGLAQPPPVAVPADPFMPPVVQDRKLYHFRAENMDIKAALAVFARANKLNIVPDRDVTGQVTLDVADLPLDRLLQALLEAHDFTWTEEDGLIRVRATETRMFSVDYIRLKRKGMGASAATLSSGGSSGGSGGSGGGGGGGGGMGGGGGGGMGGGGMGGGGGGGGSMSGSAVNLTQENTIDFWTELEAELGKILTEKGKASLAINKTAGLIQISDRPSALRKVEKYLANMGNTVQRQVEIEAKLYDVTLGDQYQFGLNWEQIARAYGGNLVVGGAPTVIRPVGGVDRLLDSMTVNYQNENTQIALRALQEQGEISVLSQPRLRTLNNQTALIKVGTDTPFFSQSTTWFNTGFNTSTPIQEDSYELITVGTILSITPQISEDNWITLDISPVITSLLETKISKSGTTTAPVLDIKQASTLVRVRSNQTIIMGGLIQNSSSKTTRKMPVLAEIPLLGYLFQGKLNAKQKKELVIFLTPTIVQ